MKDDKGNSGCSTGTCGGTSHSGIAAGFVIITAGVVWLLSRMGYFDIPGIGVMWPSILIAVGFIKLFHRPFAAPRVVFALALMAVGGLLQLSKLGLAAVDIHMIWPFLVMIAGVMVIWLSVQQRKRFQHMTVSENGIQKHIVFGGDETRYDTKQFEGGLISTVFGGAVIDLRDAEMATSPTTLEISAVFGGVELRVPTHWRVVVQGNPVLGGVENKTRVRDGLSDDEIKTFIVRGNPVFGGVEIKN